MTIKIGEFQLIGSEPDITKSSPVFEFRTSKHLLSFFEFPPTLADRLENPPDITLEFPYVLSILEYREDGSCDLFKIITHEVSSLGTSCLGLFDGSGTHKNCGAVASEISLKEFCKFAYSVLCTDIDIREIREGIANHASIRNKPTQSYVRTRSAADKNNGFQQSNETVICNADNDVYEKALDEFESNNLDRSAIAKAIAHADGVSSREKSLYIKFRAEQLVRAEKTHRTTSFAGKIVASWFAGLSKRLSNLKEDVGGKSKFALFWIAVGYLFYLLPLSSFLAYSGWHALIDNLSRADSDFIMASISFLWMTFWLLIVYGSFINTISAIKAMYE